MPEAGWGAFLAHSSVLNFIGDVSYPCSKQDMIGSASRHNAPVQALAALAKLRDRVYHSAADVAESLHNTLM